jgi:uncharacterized protein (DUF433 family)/DNA-binding transcriptional MerR regulator
MRLDSAQASDGLGLPVRANPPDSSPSHDDDPYSGIYLIPQAARILTGAAEYVALRDTYDVTGRKLLHWVRVGLLAPEARQVPGRELYLTFEDLVSMRVIASLRAAGVTFPKIRIAEEWLRQHTGKRRPFASEAMWTEASDVFSEMQTRVIAASRRGQYAMDFLRQYLIPVRGLRYQDNVAVSWEPSPSILLDPLIQFGAPCIKGTRIPTRTLWGMVEAGDSPDFVARNFGIEETAVHMAVNWEHSITADL